MEIDIAEQASVMSEALCDFINKMQKAKENVTIGTENAFSMHLFYETRQKRAVEIYTDLKEKNNLKTEKA